MTDVDQIQVLDHGFVRLVDVMGGDMSVVTSARVSYGSGSKGEEKDRKLITYMLRHDHMSPFEHAFFQFHVSCPLFVMRQWIRHRMACVTGDSELIFDLPNALERGARCAFPMRVDEFHRKWHVGAKPIPLGKRPSTQVRMPQRHRLERMRLRCLDENAWTIGSTRIVDVMASGEQPVFEVRLENGRSIRCTKEHRFRFEDGWKTLADGTGLRLEGELATYPSELPRVAANGRTVARPLHRDKAWLEEQCSRAESTDESIGKLLGVSSHVIKKWRRIHGLSSRQKTFQKGRIPWNKGRNYRFPEGRTLTAEHREAIRRARSGAASNFWKGGVSSLRARVARWTTDVGPSVFRAADFRCRSCAVRGGKLHAHHLIPVWADATKAFDINNIAALCESCHREIHRTHGELRFAETVLGSPAVTRYEKVSPRKPTPTKLVPHWVRIESIRYVGVRPTYDLTVESPFHNYVANGIITHNSYNEISARYTEMKDEFYIPEKWRVPDLKNKQSSQAAPELDGDRCTRLLRESYDKAYASYQELIKAGAARELARMVLPTSLYTQFYWTVNARSLMHFIDLRADANAQWEIQRFAEALASHFRKRMPWTWEAFLLYAWKGKNPELDAEKARLLAKQAHPAPKGLGQPA